MSLKTSLLVVDDHENFLVTMLDLLQEKGIDCIGAASGMEAIRQIEKRYFDAVLLDIKMPQLNGVETFKKIRQIRKNTIVIMMTAHKVDHLIQEALQEGVHGVLKKPTLHRLWYSERYCGKR